MKCEIQEHHRETGDQDGEGRLERKLARGPEWTGEKECRNRGLDEEAEGESREAEGRNRKAKPETKTPVEGRIAAGNDLEAEPWRKKEGEMPDQGDYGWKRWEWAAVDHLG